MKDSFTLRATLYGASRFEWLELDRTIPIRLEETPLLSEMFAYLVLHRERTVTRSNLASMFWPNLIESRARQNLSAQIWRLRKLLKAADPALDKHFLTTSQTICFAETGISFDVDIERFENVSKLAMTNWRLAVPSLPPHLDEAEILSGMFGDWVAPIRERISESYMNALLVCSEHAIAERDDRLAISILCKLIRHNPLIAMAYQRLIELAARCGDIHKAREFYENHVSVWKREFGLPPEPVIKSLALKHGLIDRDAAITRRVSSQTLSKESPYLRGLKVFSQLVEISQVLYEESDFVECEHYAVLAVNLVQKSSHRVNDLGIIRQMIEIRRLLDRVYDASCDRKLQLENLEALKLLVAGLDEPEAVIDYLLRKSWYEQSCDYLISASTFCRQALEMASACNSSMAAAACRILAVVEFGMCNYSQARLLVDNALTRDRAANNFVGSAADLINSARFRLATVNADLFAAGRELAEAEEIINSQLERRANFALIIRHLGVHAMVAIRGHSFDTAILKLNSGLELAQRYGDRDSEVWLMTRKAETYLLLGDISKACSLGMTAHMMARDLSRRAAILDTCDVMVKCSLSADLIQDARAFIDRYHDMLQACEYPQYSLRYLIRRAQVELSSNSCACNSIQRATELYQALNEDLIEETELRGLICVCQR